MFQGCNVSVMKLIVTVLVALSVKFCFSQQQDCEYPTTDVIVDIVSTNIEVLSNTDIQNSSVLCLSHSVEANRYRYASILSEYEYGCEGSGACLNTTVHQFVMVCVQSSWNLSHWIMEPAANFSTQLRQDCAFCLSAEHAQFAGVIADPITNCVGK